MAERLHDATAEIRVNFHEGGNSQEFVARIKAERFTPMVVNLQRDNQVGPHEAGGMLSIESRSPILVTRRVTIMLPADVDATIERWLDEKRLELRTAAAAKVAKGATVVKINERGEVRRNEPRG